MRALAGVDVGNATTEVVVVDRGKILGADRLPTRGRKGSAESLRGAAALVRRIERRLHVEVAEARIAPLRAVDTGTVNIAEAAPPTGRLRLLAAGVATPGGAGACVGVPLWLDRPSPTLPLEWPVVAVVPATMGYATAVTRLRELAGAGIRVGAVLVGGDEGVLVANRLNPGLPVADQVDTSAIAGCVLVAVEVCPPGRPLTLLADPVALGAALGLAEAEEEHVAALCRALLDYSNAAVGLTIGGPAPTAQGPPEPWVVVEGQRVALRAACADIAGWPVGAVRAFGAGTLMKVDDLFAVDLAAVTEQATARRGSVSRAALVASLRGLDAGEDHAALLAGMVGRPVRCLLTEPAAARLGALTTPGVRDDAVVADVGAGTIDVITDSAEVVAAGAGDLLTSAVAEVLGITRAAADWVKRGPCLRVEGSQRFEAEDGSRGFLERPAPPTATGMLAIDGPAGLLPFDRCHAPGEWRAIRLRLKQAVFAANFSRALRSLGGIPRQVVLVGGPAGDDELAGALTRSLPDGASVGRGRVGGALGGPVLGHRYAAALGLALGPAD